MNTADLKIFIGCSSRDSIPTKYLIEAQEIARNLSQKNNALVFGAASMGMMGFCYREFHKNDKSIYSYTVEKYKNDLTNLNSEKEETLPTTFDRTKKLYQQADIIILLPGGTGTIAEIFGMLEENRTINRPKKIVLYNFDGFYDKLLEIIKTCVLEKFNDPSIYDYFTIFNTRDELLNFTNNYKKERS